MNKNKKFNEAKYFLNKMLSSIKTLEDFEFNLSAFLTASRSVLQYCFEEVKINGNQKWYDNYVSNSSLIKFFKDKRDINIHFVPVTTNKRHEIFLKNKFDLNINIESIDKEGNITSQTSLLPINSKQNNNDNSGYKFSAYFDDWNGNENVIELCEKYLDEISILLREGILNKYLTD